MNDEELKILKEYYASDGGDRGIVLAEQDA